MRCPARTGCLFAAICRMTALMGVPQFPGQPASSSNRDNSKGIAAGLTSTISPNLMNSLRYSYIRQGYASYGIGQGSYANFYGMSTLQARDANHHRRCAGAEPGRRSDLDERPPHRSVRRELSAHPQSEQQQRAVLQLRGDQFVCAGECRHRGRGWKSRSNRLRISLGR